jgi:class 3 adenylate cyclase
MDERRQLTVLFCDLVGASALSQRLDPEDLQDVLRQYHSLCGDVIRRHGGYVAQYLGDGVLVYFGYPQASDDTPQRALRAGLAMVKAIRELSARLRESQAFSLEVRVGIHTGAAVVGEMGDNERPQSLAIGETVNMADRVQRAARPDSVVISDATYRLTRGFFNFRDLGPRELKGFQQLVPLYEVLNETGMRSRLDVAALGGLTPFVGREHELSVLLGAWAAAKEGQNPVVLISGEPGIGKSRHVRVLKERLEGAGERFLTVECFCSQYFQSTALHPITEMLERRLAFSREMTAHEKLSRLEVELLRTGLSAASVPLLASLLSIPIGEKYPPLDLVPQRQRQATFEALATWLLQYTVEQPVLVVMEDLHWADPSTLEFLGLVLKRQAPGPIVIVMLFRPEFKAAWDGARLTLLSLGRLPEEESKKILSGITRNRPLPAEVTKHVIDRADGVPLFVEEITKAVIESGALREADRQFELVASSTALMIPSTIQDSLMARLDRLGNTKALAQIAATLGRTFTAEMLRAVSGMPEGALRSGLDRLVEAELLFRRGEGTGETFIFRHALIQDAAYEALLRTTRQRYHHEIARTLKEQFPDIASAQPEYLAQHYAGAGLPKEAIVQWALAGQRAIARSAFAEAISVFTKAIEQLLTLPATEERHRREIELRAGLGLALISIRGFSSQEVEDTYGRARELCEQFGDVPMRILFGVWAVQVVRGERDATARLATSFKRVAESSADLSERLVAHACLATRAFYAADYGQVRTHAEQGKGYCDRETPRQQNEILMRDYGYEGLLYSHLFLAWTDGVQGRLDACRAGLDESLDLAERTGHPYVLGMGLAFGASVWRDIGEIERAASWAGRAATLCAENGFIFWLANALCVNGWLARQGGDRAGGLVLMNQGIGIFRQIGALITCPYYLSYLAEAYLEDNQVELGLATVEEGLTLTRTRLGNNPEPELIRIKGQFLARGGLKADAESHLRNALKMARDHQASLFELRSGLALGTFLGDRGLAADAAQVLGETRDRVPATLLSLKEGQALRELLLSTS